MPICILGALLLLLLQMLRSDAVALRVVDRQGAPIPTAKLTFHPVDQSSAAVSPPVPLGETTIPVDTPLSVGRELVPGRALVKVEAKGFGIGAFAVSIGDTDSDLVLGPSASVTGKVSQPDGSPLAGARVLGIGGGARGVPLVETETGVDGSFTLSGYDAGLTSLVLRVLKPGYEIVDLSWWEDNWKRRDKKDPPAIEVRATKPIRGRVELPAGVSAAGLQVVARGVPGIHAAVGTDGSFVLDHVPPDKRPRLVVRGLAAGHTHRRARAVPGDEDVQITVHRGTTITGWVLDKVSGNPIGHADVFHQHGPEGMATSRAKADGSFTIDQVPAGQLVLSAQVSIPGARPPDPLFRSGIRELEIAEGQPRRDIIIRID